MTATNQPASHKSVPAMDRFPEGRSRRLRIGRRLPNPGRKRRPGPVDGWEVTGEVGMRSWQNKNAPKHAKGGWQKTQNASNNSLRVK